MSKPLFEEFIKKTSDKVFYLINNIKDSILKQSMISMFESIQSEYFIAPASSNINYHNCFDGGLADHSLRVFTYISQVSKSINFTIDNDMKIVAGLVHDLCKIGDGDGNSYYIPTTSDWDRKNGKLYKYNNSNLVLKMPGSDRTMYLLSKFNIKLPIDTYLAIKLADGQYVDENKPYKQKESNFALIVHFADMWATFEERNNINNLPPYIRS